MSVLLTLADGAKKANQIVEVLGGSEVGAARTLDLLEAMEFVTRTSDDRYAKVVYVGAGAEDEVDKMLEIIHAVLAEFHDRYFEAQKAEHTDFAALDHGVPFGVLLYRDVALHLRVCEPVSG